MGAKPSPINGVRLFAESGFTRILMKFDVVRLRFDRYLC